MIVTRTSGVLALCVVIVGSLLAAMPARAAFELEPGQWQDTETGTENGQPAKPEVTSDCMTPAEAEDPVKVLLTLKDQQSGQCKTVDVKQNGNTVSFVMKCGDPKQMSFDIAATYTFVDQRHYTGTLKSTVILAGRKTTSDKKVDSKWIGACKK